MRRLAAAMLAAFILPATAPVARADVTSCVGDLGNVIVAGDLVVPEGARCVLREATVTGSVRVGRDAGLQVFDGVIIRGNVRVDHCDYATFEPSAPGGLIAVGGNVDIQHCSETSGKIFTPGRVAIGGNFACHDNAAPCFAVSLTIGGDAQINDNAAGISYIEGNIINGNLECVGNKGVTDYGSPNTVAGTKLGECAALSN